VVRLAAALACGGTSLTLLAQQPPARPAPGASAAAAAPAAPAASARGFGSARGPLLTRDELRVCLGQEDELKKRLETQDAARGPLEQEKKTIADEQALMRGERAKLEAPELSAAVTAFTERNKAFTERRARWDARVKAYNDAGRTATADERDALNVERAALEKEHAALEAERQRLQAQQAARTEAAQAFNVKIRALDARVGEWNKRNNAYNDAIAALEGDRAAWVSNCGNRRYREEDELAIRSGK
jgi:chromosome segregation ATPase